MRSNRLVKTLIGATALVGITAGSLVACGTASAATPGRQQTALAGPASATEVVDLGLSVAQAKKVQNWLADLHGYTGPIDGALGTGSWQAMQRYLRQYSYTGAIGGVVGTGTIKALQRFLKDFGYYSGAVDGVAGAGTKAAFAEMADSIY
ncbi:peptidoglycan-binding domain-containing protein [Streptomyces sp. NPDC056178]|uniref:peptidoglycan-binding domain-containing protein n=1 Tax=Streptomyces sp. NPDC056178 TaxID=3345735 RepID=UPI0035E0B7BA